MKPPKTPRWTDTEKHPHPYADAEASRKPGYMARRFKAIAEQQKVDAAEREAKVSALPQRRVK